MTEPLLLEFFHRGTQIRYRWRVSNRTRRFRVSVGPDGVEVVTPVNASRGDAERFLRLHADWVVAQQERFQKLESRRRPPGAAMANLPSGTILIEGHQITLQLREDPGRQIRAKVEEAGGFLQVSVPEGGLGGAELALTSYLKKKAGRLIPARVELLGARFGKTPNTISIRSQKSRWGSCSSRGTLSFNWRLVMVPPEVLDYVILHELTHMTEPNHSQRFWQKLAILDSEYQRHRRWLRENQSYLYDPLIR